MPTTQYYEDSFYAPAKPSGDNDPCGPNWNTGKLANGTAPKGCLLWSRSYNGYYITEVDNGQGLTQTFTWVNDRTNQHGVTSGQDANDPNYCTRDEASRGANTAYPCDMPDDNGWSHITLKTRTETVDSPLSNNSGNQTTGTWTYVYDLTNLVAHECADCNVGFYWGNTDEADYLDYYNGKFTGYSFAEVLPPDGSLENDYFYATDGWGVYDTSQYSTCTNGYKCYNAPAWDTNDAASGRPYEVDQFAPEQGSTWPLLKRTLTNYSVTCPPSGVSGSPPTTWGNWDHNLVAELDEANPVAACDVQTGSTTAYAANGLTSYPSTGAISNVPDAQVSNTYNSYGQLTKSTTTGDDLGTTPTMVANTSFIWDDNVQTASLPATGTYIVDTAAFQDVEDGASHQQDCTYTHYDGGAYNTGQQSSLTKGLATESDKYATCASGGGTGEVITKAAYNTNGDSIGSIDADANAGISGHTGACTINSASQTTCNTYDSTYGTLPSTKTNVFGHSTQTNYATSSGFGFGQWPSGVTDLNGQTTSNTYDALGRLTSVTKPGETSGDKTTAASYVVTCPATGAAAPCLVNVATQRIDSSHTATTYAFYDGWGHLVETLSPGPSNQTVVRYAEYNALGDKTFLSQPYFVSGTQTTYQTPDVTQPGTAYGYDALHRLVSSTDPNSATTTTSFSAVCAPAGTGDSACYTATTTHDPLGHQAISYTDALARDRYEQRFTGTSSYTLYATGSYSYDYLGDILTVTEPGSATITYTYDMLGRKTGETDPDTGTWGYTYDPNGNTTKQVDARGSAGTVYLGYDGLNRELWRSVNSDGSSPFATYSYDSTANGNAGLGELTSETFTSGPTNNVTGTYAYTYDDRGRKSSWSLTVNSNTYTVGSTFNDADQAITTTYPDGDVVTTSYDGNDWLAGATETLSGTNTTLATAMNYAGLPGANGQATSATEANGLYTLAMGYDLDNRLNTVTATLVSNGSTLFSQARQFDATGNTVAQQTQVATGTDNEAFCYDDLNRLVWAGSNGTPSCGASLTPGSLTGAYYQQSYSYDSQWRLTTGPAGSGYTYGDSAHLHAVTSTANGYTASYDAAGDMTCRAPTSSQTCTGSTPTGQTWQYDAERHLLQWQSQPSGAQTYASYGYDGSGDRVWQQVTNGSTTTTTVFLGQLEEIATTGGTTTTTKYYFVGTRRVAERVGSTLSFLVADGLSSVAQALDTSGNIVASQLFTPYGSLCYQSGTMPTAYGFTGLYADPSGTDYAQARRYDPVVGAFTQADDTLPGSGIVLGGLNRYAYVTGNPETLTDPTGHWGWGDLVSAVTSTVSNVVQAVTPAVSAVVQAAAPVVSAVAGAVTTVANTVLGVSDMVNDVKTLFNPNASWQDKFGSIVNLGFNAFMDATTVMGVGEGLKAIEIGGKLATDVGEHAVEEVGAHAVEDVGERSVEDGGEVAAEDAVGETCSFAYATLVTTPHGKQQIGTLKVGETVLAYDGATGKVKAEPVQHVLMHHDNDLLDVTLSTVSTTSSAQGQGHSATKQHEAEVAAHGAHASPSSETIHTTTEHPFLTKELGWVNAQDLQPGEHVRRMDGSLGVVVGVTVVPGEAVRYNLTVAQDHTYLVGQNQWVVHNTCANPAEEPQRYADERAHELQDALPEGSRGRVTMGVGVAEDENGVLRTIIGTSERNGYLRAGVRDLVGADDIVARGVSHAERNILSEVASRGWRIIAVGAGRPICDACFDAIVRAGGEDAVASVARNGFIPFWMR